MQNFKGNENLNDENNTKGCYEDVNLLFIHDSFVYIV